MNTTLYEILEVSENASQEVIEKAYKVLAKKYHPDLQTPENKQMAEQKMKQINEAYDILSDDSKRKIYDEKLKSKREKEKQSNANIDNQRTVTGASYATNYTSQSQGQTTGGEQNSYRKQDVSQEEQRYREMQIRRYEEQLRKQQEQMQQNMQEQKKFLPST